MSSTMQRRDFLKTAPAAAMVFAQTAKGAPSQASAKPSPQPPYVLESFDYRGVRLLDSLWQKQFQAARDYYLSVSDDDILCGFRKDAGLPAPGKTLGGWCARDSSTVFGQWLSGMSRIARATDDAALRDKVVGLMTEWAKTIRPDGSAGGAGGPYAHEKIVGGLVDMKLYLDRDEAVGYAEKITDYAIKTFDRTRTPAGPIPWERHSGKPGEWYTQAENQYRAYLLTKNPKFKEFGDVWLYPDYWNKFADTADPKDAHGVHAYSHVNSFSSAAMAYAVTRDASYLRILKNAYDFLQNTQCFATGGYGPAERILPTDGSLGRSLEMRMDDCETPCCSWAGFKMARYLMLFTGEARYGDWLERLLYNGVGGILWITTGGKHFYYADYRSAAVKYYSRNPYTCCSGTYIQDVAAYHDLIYFKDASSLCVNLYLPSEVVWNGPDGEIKLVQETKYPEAETSLFTLGMKRPAKFALKFRVPGWAKGMSITVNGAAAGVACAPGMWAVCERSWNPGDKVEVRIPLGFRMQPVDRWHPNRAAIVRGPVVYVQEGNNHEPVYRFPADEAELNKQLVPVKDAQAAFKFTPPDGTNVQGRVRPFYSLIEDHIYRMYLDLDKLPYSLW